uniref:DUF3778 domain-containing protein n=1 Tax=Oryza glumipatula TaxID=40148 RepID=A0A0E0ARV9_9ORYZ
MVAGAIDGVGVGRWRAVDVSWQLRGLVVVVVGVLQLVEVEDMLDLKLEVMGRCLVLPPPWSLLLRMEVLLVLYEKVYCLWSLSLCAGCGLGWWWCFVPLASVRDDGVVAGVGDVVVPTTELAKALLRPPPSSGPQLVLLLHLLLVHSFPTLCIVPFREQFIRQWLCSSLLQGGSGVLLPLRFWAVVSTLSEPFGLSSYSDSMANSVVNLHQNLRLNSKSPICADSVKASERDYRFVKRSTCQRRPKVAIVAASPQLPVDSLLLRYLFSLMCILLVLYPKPSLLAMYGACPLDLLL